jgi:hypothetical protein
MRKAQHGDTRMSYVDSNATYTVYEGRVPQTTASRVDGTPGMNHFDLLKRYHAFLFYLPLDYWKKSQYRAPETWDQRWTKSLYRA